MKLSKMTLLTLGFGLALQLQGCGVESTASLSSGGAGPSQPVAQGAKLVMTGKVRMYESSGRQALQIDVRSGGDTAVFGPNVSINISGLAFYGGHQLYPYYGGNTSKANTVFPGDLGYIMLKLPAGDRVDVGQRLGIDVTPAGDSNFAAFHGGPVVCQKGTAGCE